MRSKRSLDERSLVVGSGTSSLWSGAARGPEMILGVNGVRLIGGISGVGRAIEAILQSLAVLDHPFEEIRVYAPRALDPAVQLPGAIRTVVVSSPLPLGLWEQFVLPRAHGRSGPLLCPSYVAPWMPRAPSLLIHHGSYEGHKDAFGWWTRNKARLVYGLSAHRATRVTTVSEHSRRDMARFYRLRPERITVIPEGVDTQRFRPRLDTEAVTAWRTRVLGADVPFLLYVGKLAKRRNVPNLVEAFRRLKQDGFPHRLVTIGADPIALREKTGRSLEAEGVVAIRFAGHDDIALAYNAADALVYPSSYEGFGMPVLEALACGTPVIALNSTAFPEFSGGIARLLPDAEVGTLHSAIRALLEDPGERTRVLREGPPRAREYDWRRVTARYLELLRELAA